jgi:guanosine-3',5'-bis(diphosphate) 3'-pyrophosphohydrolase
MNLSRFLGKVKQHNPQAAISLIKKAFSFSQRAHQGQLRKSGEPYFHHCIQVALILVEHGLDSTTVAAALLHDIVEDAGLRVEVIEREFSQEIASLVDGVTKIGGLAFRSKEERQAENYRKMILSMAKDIRVILIKFADRLHNMRTLQYLPQDRIVRIAQETRDVYAPLAHRLGMDQIKREMEDLSLKFLNPHAYEELADKLAHSTETRAKYIEKVKKPLAVALREAGIKAQITGRAKPLASIYRKIKERHKPLEEIYDLTAVRVVTLTDRDCYHALGIIHNLWRPFPDRFKDFIAVPKSNMYQALHTTVMGPGGEPVEIQIRTKSMHQTAEMGIAAHWMYKEGRHSRDELDEYMGWLRQVLDWQRDLTDPEEFMEYLKIDLYGEEIFVFTPKGDLKQLPRGATPLDFAFSVHTDVGLHCQGAKVNDRMVPLASELHSGDTVEIITSPAQHPSRDWISFVKTSRAKSKIRHWLKQQSYQQSLALGKELFDRELKKAKLKLESDQKLLSHAREFGFLDLDHFFAALGSGDLSINQVLGRLSPGILEKVAKRPLAIRRLVRRRKALGRGVRIQGLDNLMVRFARCCQPIPGDNIVGFVTRGRGISIHRASCANSIRLMEHPERQVTVEWSTERGQVFPVRIEVVGERRVDLLSDVTRVVSDMGADVRNASVQVEGEAFFGRFVIQVQDIGHLQKTIDKIRRVRGVERVNRLTRGRI